MSQWMYWNFNCPSIEFWVDGEYVIQQKEALQQMACDWDNMDNKQENKVEAKVLLKSGNMKSACI